jgi:DeoR/GlpR family transcriptional regulator of sugar metabolism
MMFQVSTATARRDIDSLARRGVAVRVHGGAVLPETVTAIVPKPSFERLDNVAQPVQDAV